MSQEIHRARFAELDTRTLHDLLRLRVDVFVVEQACPYPEIDGRDTEPGTRHLWLADPATGAPTAYLRVLAEPGGSPSSPGSHGIARIGRVVTAPSARGGGAAGRLMSAALEEIGPRDVVLDAQAHLAGFYARFGFTPSGPEFLEDGIPHVPMTRPAP